MKCLKNGNDDEPGVVAAGTAMNQGKENLPNAEKGWKTVSKDLTICWRRL
jgi:hypothetical protein